MDFLTVTLTEFASAITLAIGPATTLVTTTTTTTTPNTPTTITATSTTIPKQKITVDEWLKIAGLSAGIVFVFGLLGVVGSVLRIRARHRYVSSIQMLEDVLLIHLYQNRHPNTLVAVQPLKTVEALRNMIFFFVCLLACNGFSWNLLDVVVVHQSFCMMNDEFC